MRIVLVNKYFHLRGGAERRFFTLRRLLRQSGHKVIDFSMTAQENEPSEYRDYFVSQIDYGQSASLVKQLKNFGRMLYSLEAKRKFSKLLDDTRPDLVHVHNIYNHISYSIIDAARKRGIPVVMTLHEYRILSGNFYLFDGRRVCKGCVGGNSLHCLLGRCFKRSFLKTLAAVLLYGFERRIFRIEDKVAAFVVPSLFAKKLMIKRGFDPKKIFVIPHPITNNPSSQINFNSPGITSSYVLYAGRLSEEKGIMLLLEAFKDLPQITLKIAGGGSLSNFVQDYIAQNRIKNIQYLGFLKDVELRQVIFGSRFGVVPSLTYENVPFAILEAYLAAKPVVASRIGSLPEAVRHNITGILFKVGDKDALKKAVQSLWNKDLRAMGEAGYQFVNEGFKENVYLQSVLRAYKRSMKCKV